MKKILFLSVIFITVFTFFYVFFNSKITEKKIITQKQIKKIVPTPVQSKIMKNIFIPYWDIPKTQSELSKYDETYYFSLSVNSNGLNKTNENWSNLKDFLKLNLKSQYLTISLLDQNQNSDILKDKNWQEKIITDTIAEAEKSSFSGVILDLEMSPSLSSATPNRITEFVSNFYTETKQSGLKFYITLYGDNFYRARPYDIKELNKYCDKFLIMAYDLHKATGEPGPNFPLDKGDNYPYDIKTLTETLLTIVPPQKIEFIFGMYGYNWVVNEYKKPFSPAKSMSYLDIKKSYLDTCQWKNCVVKRDDVSTEMEIDYIDEKLNYRIVWFEDMESATRKMEYLKSKNILNFSFWNFGYF